MKKNFVYRIILVIALTIITFNISFLSYESTFSLKNFSVNFIDVANSNPIGGTDCWNTYTRNGQLTKKVCEGWAGNEYFTCKNVTDVDNYDNLGTCLFQ